MNEPSLGYVYNTMISWIHLITYLYIFLFMKLV